MEHIFIVGGTTFDHIVSLKEFPEPKPHTIHQSTFFETTGSTGSGKALCLNKLEVPNTLYSIMGDDIYGKRIVEHLRNEKVNLIYDIDPKGTERHINIMDAEGGRISIFVTQSSESPNVNMKLVDDTARNSDVIVLNIISYCKLFIPVLKRHGKPIWTDLHDYNDGNPYHEPFIDAADFILLSSDNLTNYRQTMQNLMQRGKELVVCTHGKNGVTALTKQGEWIDEPAIPNLAIVDTNGAGDNFFSGFLYAFLKGKTIADCLKYGTICGGTCVTSKQLVSEKLSLTLLESEYKKLYTD